MAPRWPGPKPEIGSDPLEGLFDGIFGNLIQAIVRAVMGIFIPGGGGGIPSGTNPLSFLSDLMGQRWNQVDDMQESTQKFEGIQVYGARYMPSNMSPTDNLKRAPFTGNTHEGVGVTYSGSEIILNSRGLFTASAQCFFSWITGGGSGCYMDIVVRRPDGSEFSRKPAIARTTNTVTVFNSHTFGVPGPGYRLSVEAAADPSIIGVPTRVINGGQGYTHLVVNKWSSEPE